MVEFVHRAVDGGVDLNITGQELLDRFNAGLGRHCVSIRQRIASTDVRVDHCDHLQPVRLTQAIGRVKPRPSSRSHHNHTRGAC